MVSEPRWNALLIHLFPGYERALNNVRRIKSTEAELRAAQGALSVFEGLIGVLDREFCLKQKALALQDVEDRASLEREEAENKEFAESFARR